MKTDFETLSLEQPAPHVLLITMDRPRAANAMNTQMGVDLMGLFESLLLKTEDLRCLILTGRGDKAFCAGGDLKERKGMTDQQWLDQHAIFERMVRAILGCPVPLIAAVNGAAYGGGCEVAAASDFVYASTTARFALPEVTLGIMPGAGGTQNLSRAVGARRSKELIMTGAPFNAAKAADWGLVNELCAPDELMSATLATATCIAENAPISVRQAKQSIQRGLDMSIWDGLSFEIEAYNRMVPTADRHEGVLAYNERRKPMFKGE